MWWEFKVLLTAGIISIIATVAYNERADGLPMTMILKRLRFAFLVCAVLICLWWIWGPTRYEFNAQSFLPEKLEKP